MFAEGYPGEILSPRFPAAAVVVEVEVEVEAEKKRGAVIKRGDGGGAMALAGSMLREGAELLHSLLQRLQRGPRA